MPLSSFAGTVETGTGLSINPMMATGAINFSTGATGAMNFSTGATGAADYFPPPIDLNLINETLNGVVQRLGLIQRIVPGITDADLMMYMAQSTTQEPASQTQGTGEVLNDTPLNDTPLNDAPLNDAPLNDAPLNDTPPPSDNNSDTPPPSENDTTPPPSNNDTTPPPSENDNTPPPSDSNSENNMSGGGKKMPKRKTRRRNKKGLNSTR